MALKKNPYDINEKVTVPLAPIWQKLRKAAFAQMLLIFKGMLLQAQFNIFIAHISRLFRHR